MNTRTPYDGHVCLVRRTHVNRTIADNFIGYRGDNYMHKSIQMLHKKGILWLLKYNFYLCPIDLKLTE